MPMAVGMLALTSGLAAACFVKAFGITFLAIPRSARRPSARTRRRCRCSAGWRVLAVACVALGLGAGPRRCRSLARRADRVSVDSRRPPSPARWRCRSACPAASAQMSPAARWRPGLILLSVAVLLALRVLGRRSAAARGRHLGLRADRPDAAHGVHGDRVRRAAAAGLRRAVPADRRTCRSTSTPSRGTSSSRSTYRSEIHPWFERAALRPARRLSFAPRRVRVRRLQAGSVHLYLVYMIAGARCVLLAGGAVAELMGYAARSRADGAGAARSRPGWWA